MLTTNRVFATRLTLQELLPNRSRSKGAFVVFLINHIDAQHVTERSFYTEIMTVMLIVLAPGGATFIYPHGARSISGELIGNPVKFSLDWCPLIYIYPYIHLVHMIPF